MARGFFFWSSLFGVLHASWTFIGISFFRFGKFSSIILLNIFSGPLICSSSPSSITIILRFVFFLLCPRFLECFVMRICWICCFLWSEHLFSLWYLQTLRFVLPSLVSYWLCLILYSLFIYLDFPYPPGPRFVFWLLYGKGMARLFYQVYSVFCKLLEPS